MDKNLVILVLIASCMFALVGCTGKGQQPKLRDGSHADVIASQAEVNPNLNPIPQGTFAKHIVVLKPGVSQLVRDSVAGALTKPTSHMFNTVFVGFATDISQTELDSLNADSRIAYVEEDLPIELCRPILENHPDDDPWGIRNDLTPIEFVGPTEGSIHLAGTNIEDWGVSRINAFPSPGLQGAGITVAIIDTGIDVDHPDLVGAIVAEYDAVNDVEGVGVADDLHGHGTHVAGIVGARDNDIATVGVAPECSLAGIKVFGGAGGSGSNSDLIRGIDWIAANHNVVSPPIKVANMSLSGTGTSRSMYDAIQACNDLGITTVVAAGNDFRDASQQMPANFDNVITVSAMRRVWNAGSYDYKFAMFSNFGNVVDLIAPGQSIHSLRNNGSTRTMSGTSMACPHVAGAAALYLDENLGDGFQETFDALVTNGEAGTWTGDPDGVYEPLVDAIFPRWHRLAVASSGGDNGTSLIVVDGNPAISWNSPNGNMMYVRAMNADGSSWGTPISVDTGDTYIFPSLCVVNGNPAISYYDYSNRDLKYVRAMNVDGSTWGIPLTIDFAGTTGIGPSLVVVDGNPTIAYYDHSYLKYVRAMNADGSSWETPQIIDSGGRGGWVSLAVVNGNPAISYWDKYNNDLKFIRATNADGSSWATPQTLDSTGDTGGFTSLCVVDGNPAVSYDDVTNHDMKYIRATNADGSSWETPQTPDFTGDTGGSTSLCVVDGNPAISYRDITNHDLKYIRATNADGSTWDTPQAIDTAGWYTSLAIVDGNPAISYYDETNEGVKFAYFGR